MTNARHQMVTGRFANVLCRSAKKRNEPSLSHDTKKCDTHVYTSFFQPVIRQKQLGNWPNTYAKRIQKLVNRTLAKRLVGETTVNTLFPLTVSTLKSKVLIIVIIITMWETVRTEMIETVLNPLNPSQLSSNVLYVSWNPQVHSVMAFMIM